MNLGVEGEIEDDCDYGSRKVTQRQWLYLLNAVDKDKELCGSFSGPLGRGRFGKKWDELAKELNKLGTIHKNGVAWNQAYVGLRNRAKTALAPKKVYLQRTGGGPPLTTEECLKMGINAVYARSLEIHGTITATGHGNVPNPLELQVRRDSPTGRGLQQHTQTHNYRYSRNLNQGQPSNTYDSPPGQYHAQARDTHFQHRSPDVRRSSNQSQSPRFFARFSPYGQRRSTSAAAGGNGPSPSHTAMRSLNQPQQPTPSHNAMRTDNRLFTSPPRAPIARKQLFGDSGRQDSDSVGILVAAINDLVKSNQELKAVVAENSDALRILTGHIYNQAVE